MATPGYFEKKSDVAELRTRLQNAMAKKDEKACRSAIKKIIQYMTLGIDVSELFPHVIMTSVTNDIVQKKLVYLYICSCAESNAELALLTVNTLVKDTTDHNPMVRGLALRSMLNMRLPMIIDYVKEPLLSALEDRSSYVRRNAVIGCIKFNKLAPNQFEEMGLDAKLMNKLNDNHSQVTMNAFLALDEVLRETGGLSLTKDIVRKMLSRLPDFNEWSQCMLLNRLVRYQPQDEDEIIEYLNFLDDRLTHSNKGVVLAALNLFLRYTKNVDYLAQGFYERIRSPILSILNSSIPEVVYVTLKNISILIKTRARLFHEDFKIFFLRTNDLSYVCHQKLEILTDIVTEGNLQNIIEELRQYVRHDDYTVSCQAIQSIGAIGLNHPFASEPVTYILLDLLKSENDVIIDNALQSLKELMMKYASLSSVVLPEVNEAWESIQHYSIGKAALVWIYGEYGEDIPSSPYKLEELVDNIQDIDSISVKLNLLTGMLKLFFKRPPECQKTLGKLFKYFCGGDEDSETNMDIRDRALFYYRLLQNDIQKAKEIVFSKEDIEQARMSNFIGTLSDDDFRFQEFNTLSIIYGQPSSTFIMSSNQLGQPILGKNDNDDDELPHKREKHQSTPEKVPVGNILDFIDEPSSIGHENSSGETGASIQLDPRVNLEADQFKSSWFSAPFAKSLEQELTVEPEHQEILSIMQNKNIKLRAANQPNASPWKFFFYAKQVNEETLFLIELVIQRSPKTLAKIQIKTTQSTDRLETFVEYIRNLFIGYIALT
ncbi:uncharacterized protein [Clytia hemisphaerica]|uniref:AP complex subunit beta n=1 Tax=Clytia hemisphaerica TaxID=252671 RepID=A0A7M5X523_9CNID